jgi:hypothetical protein
VAQGVECLPNKYISPGFKLQYREKKKISTRTSIFGEMFIHVKGDSLIIVLKN